MLLSPQALKSWVLQWGKGEPFQTNLEERQMTAHPQNLIRAACELEGALRLYFPSLAFIPLLFHTPLRLCEALLWKGKQVWKGRRPCPWDARSSGASWDRMLCSGAPEECVQAVEKGHSGVTSTLARDGLSLQWMLWTWRRNCCAGFSGPCYAWNQTRWSFLALKFSYSKILSYFPFPLNVRNISSQSPATSFFFKRAGFFFFAEKIQRSFLFSEIYYFLLLALWAMRKESVCLRSSLTSIQLFWVPCEDGSQLFLRSCIHLQTRNPSVCVHCLPLFFNFVVWHDWGFEQPKQCYRWDHTDDLWDRDWHHRLFLILETGSSITNAWERI